VEVGVLQVRASKVSACELATPQSSLRQGVGMDAAEQPAGSFVANLDHVIAF
jgi:hypothetical protein